MTNKPPLYAFGVDHSDAGSADVSGRAGARRSQEWPHPSMKKEAGSPWYSRGYVPHFDQQGSVQHVTFHLSDSLPRDVLKKMEASIAALPNKELQVERRKRLLVYLDNGYGSCLLKRNEPAHIVEQALHHFDGDRYHLLAWCVMPNHVHVLIELTGAAALGKIVQSWKSFTARAICGLGLDVSEDGSLSRAEPGQASWRRSQGLWHRDYWDRFIRDENHYVTAVRYIEENPVQAGLCQQAIDWPWSSASWDRRQEACPGSARPNAHQEPSWSSAIPGGGCFDE